MPLAATLCSPSARLPRRDARVRLLGWLLAAVFGACVSAGPAHAQETAETLTGWLTLVWADGQPTDPDGPRTTGEPVAFLTSDDGRVRRLRMSPALVRAAGGLRRFDRRRVAVSLPAVAAAAALPVQDSASPVLRPTGLRLLVAADGAVTQGDTPGVGADAAVTGSYPWVTLACKFPDVVVEPKTISYFSSMYGNAAPGLDHYWRELSYATADIAGSTAAGWFTLPRVRSAYIYDMDGDGVVDADLDGLFGDCTAAATPSVDFRTYQGINLMFNSNLDGPAWGGALYATLDGVTKRWSVTWEPPWAYADISVIAHEMGHGFGLPHSSYGPSDPYDNAWDVMSKDRSGCPPEDAVYGCTGQHTIAYHKDLLGWIPSPRKVAVSFGASATVTLERLALPSTTNARMVTVDAGTPDGKFFTVEVRRRTGYDTKLPADAVVIHEVVPNRSDDRPAHVIDSDGNGVTSDAGAIWSVGETFTDPSGVQISVTAATASGFTISVGGATTAPTLSSILPTTGTTAGATSVTVTGTGFVVGQTTVRFGGQLSPSVTVATSTQLTAATPAGVAGSPVDVVVQTSNGQATLSQAFTYLAPPSISGITPSAVPAHVSATLVAVTGANFTAGATSAAFVSSTVPAVTTPAAVSNVTPSSLTVSTPWLTPGTYTLQVTTSSGSATTPVWFYGMPSISSIAPSLGPVGGGTSVTIAGSNFVAGSTVVTVAGASVPVTVSSPSALTFVTPAGAVGPAALRVGTPAGYTEFTSAFEYLAPPTLTVISPTSGPAAGATTRMSLTGTHFHDRLAAPLTVRVGGVLATDLWYYNASQVSVLVPAGTPGGSTVTVTTGGGTATLPSAFTYVAAPTVTSVLPARGPAAAATPITVSGTGFIVGDTAVLFGSGPTPYSATEVIVESPTSLRVTAPLGLLATTYALRITTTGGTHIAPNAYTAVSAPQVSAIAPSTGLPAGNTLVALTGAHFLAGDVQVTIGGVPATSVVVTSPVTVEARTPALAVGARDVVVTTSGGSATVVGGFTYTVTPVLVPPVITSVTPSIGPAAGGTVFTVRGTAFTPDATLTVSGVASSSVTYLSTTTLVATTPALPAGRHAITITTADGTTTMAEAFESIGPWTGYFAEGATSVIFDTRFALMNPNEMPAQVAMRFLATDGGVRTHTLTVGARTRATIDVKALAGMTTSEFSTTIDADVPIIADRTMTWDAVTRYGAHAETAIPAPSPTWYLAEGATHSGFDLFYLLQNPGASETTVRVRYLRPSGAPIEKTYRLAPTSRTNIWVNVESFDGLGLALASTDVSAVIESLDGTPIIVERALYLSSQGRLFNAGHESAGVTAPRTQWFLAEGATGSYFDLFVLIANPNAQAADVRLTYLLTDGRTFSRMLTAPPHSRSNVWVDEERFAGVDGFPLADVAVSTTVEALNGVPIIVERSLWWPGSVSQWHEAHNSAGAWQTGTAWALAEGEVGGPYGEETYVLVANTSAFSGHARVTLLFEDGSSSQRTYPLPALSRTNVAVGPDFGAITTNRRFGVLIESLGEIPAQIVVERAMYHDAGGMRWAAGTNALATKLR